MIRRRLAAFAFAAGCLLSQTGCAGLWGTNNNNNCNTGSTCCLSGLFGRFGLGSSSNSAACCPTTCAPTTCGSTCASTPMMGGMSGFDGVPSANVIGGGAPGCNCSTQGGAPMMTIPNGLPPGAIPSGAPITYGDMGAPMSGPPALPPGAIPSSPMPNPGPPRIVPVPSSSPVPQAGYQQWQPH